MFVYYYRDAEDESEIIIRKVNGNTELSIRVSESGSETAMLVIDRKEVEAMIRALQKAHQEMK